MQHQQWWVCPDLYQHQWPFHVQLWEWIQSSVQGKDWAVMVWHCCRVCERVEEQSRIQQVIDDVSNHLNMGENIAYLQK